MKKSIVLLPGDGIGPEVTAAARMCSKSARANSIINLTFRNIQSVERRST